MKRILVFFPTYNEANNVERLITTIRQFLPSCHLLVVDDASPDGTGELLDRIAADIGNFHVIHRPGKLGLGSAHQLAMLYAREHGYDALITMDADFSHHPRYLPRFVELLGDADFVIGSRFAPGGVCDYGLGRIVISRSANIAAKIALGLGLEENTTMYRGYTADLLARLDIEAIRSEGYSFACESLYQVGLATRRMVELPIHFENRAAGASKISQKEIFKAVVTIQRLGLKRLAAALRPRPVDVRGEPLKCCCCGSTYHVEVYPARNSSGRSRAQDTSPYSCATHSSRSHGQILRCLQCGLIFMRPKLSEDELVSEYARAVDPVYLENLPARLTTFRKNLETVRSHFEPGDRVLEIGSYCGGFLKVARDAGIDVTGLEPSKWAVDASRGVTDAPVICGTADDLPEDALPFDVVVAWDVLEHFADPVAELKKINALLPPGGRLIFSTLMIDNWFPQALREYWPWLMDMHLFYFTETSVKNVLSTAGFEIVGDGRYTHVVTLEYLFEKLGTLGVPAAPALSRAAAKSPIGTREIPFRFGDIKYFVCKKTRDVPRPAKRPAGTVEPLGGRKTGAA